MVNQARLERRQRFQRDISLLERRNARKKDFRKRIKRARDEGVISVKESKQFLKGRRSFKRQSTPVKDVKTQEVTQITEETPTGTKTFEGKETTLQGRKVFVGARTVTRQERAVQSSRQFLRREGPKESDVPSSITLQPSSQFGVKQALPIFTLQQRLTGQPLEIETQKVTKSVEPTPAPTKEKTEFITTGQEKRVKQLLEREERLQTGLEAVTERLGIEKREGENFLVGVGKAVLRKPFEFASAPVFVGGRVAFAAESVFSRPGRSELGRAAVKTPGTVVKSFDPRKPEGIVNLAFAAFAVKRVGGAIKQSRTQPSFTTQGTATKRFTTPNQITDVSKGRIEALVGKQKISAQFSGKETFFRQTKSQFISKGSGKIQITKPAQTIKLSSRGISTVKTGGATTTTISKVVSGTGKSKLFLTATRTKQIVSKPFQSFRSLSATKILGKKTSITSGKPAAVSTGVTVEAFRRSILTESGKTVGTQQILNTAKISISPKVFDKNFITTINKPTISGSIPKTTFTSTATSSTGTVALQSLKGQTLLGATQAQLTNVAATVKSAQVGASATQGTAAVLAVKPVTTTKTVPTQTTRQIPTTKLTSRLRVKPQSTQRFRAVTTTNFKVTTLPISQTAFKPLSATTQNVRVATSTAQQTKAVTKFATPSPIAPVVTPVISTPSILPPLPPFRIPDSKPKKRKKRQDNIFTQPIFFAPSATGQVFKIRVPKSQISKLSKRTLTGFELRPGRL